MLIPVPPIKYTDVNSITFIPRLLIGFKIDLKVAHAAPGAKVFPSHTYLAALAAHCKWVTVLQYVKNTTLKFTAHFQWESGQNCRKINQVAVESFQVLRASWGSNCICMQLKTFGLNERVTLGTNNAPDHHGRGLLNFTLHHQLRLRPGMRFSKLHQQISIL